MWCVNIVDSEKPVYWHGLMNIFADQEESTVKHEKNQLSHNVRKHTYAPNDDSDHPAHSRSRIKIFAGRILNSQGCKVFHVDNED